MFLALATAVVAIVLGAIGAFVAHERLWALAPVRAFAVIAVAASVALHLLPAAISEAGWAVVVVGALGFVAPPLVGRLAAVAAAGARHRRLAIELGYAGVLLHQIGDGLGMGAATRDGVEWAFLAGVVAHSVPLVAMITLTFAEVGGARSTVWRVLGMLAATALGVALTGSEVVLPHSAGPWINAAVAGLLFHILLHDADDREVPAATRPLEALGVVVGVVLPLVADRDHGEVGLGGALPDALAAAVALVGTSTLVALGLCRVLVEPPRRTTWRNRLVGPVVPLVIVLVAYGLAATRDQDGQVWPLFLRSVPAAVGRVAAAVVGVLMLWRVATVGFLSWLGTGHDHGHDDGGDPRRAPPDDHDHAHEHPH